MNACVIILWQNRWKFFLKAAGCQSITTTRFIWSVRSSFCRSSTIGYCQQIWVKFLLKCIFICFKKNFSPQHLKFLAQQQFDTRSFPKLTFHKANFFGTCLIQIYLFCAKKNNRNIDKRIIERVKNLTSHYWNPLPNKNGHHRQPSRPKVTHSNPRFFSGPPSKARFTLMGRPSRTWFGMFKTVSASDSHMKVTWPEEI